MMAACRRFVLKMLALEASAGVAVDIDAELRAAGLANVLCGGLGGGLANHSSTYVGTLRRIGVSDRRVAVAAQLLAVGALAWPWPLSNFVPPFVLGGLLGALGLGMMLDWVMLARKRMDANGLVMLVGMVATSVWGGTVHAVLLALLVAVGSSHLRASRLHFLQYHLTARSYHPPRSRSLSAQSLLARRGDAIHLIGLDGFLHEGTMAKLLRYTLKTVNASRGGLRYLILDFRSAQGLDPSAAALLGRATHILAEQVRDRDLPPALPFPRLLSPFADLLAHPRRAGGAARAGPRRTEPAHHTAGPRRAGRRQGALGGGPRRRRGLPLLVSLGRVGRGCKG